MAHRTYKLDDLARAAGTSVRTIRYYVQRGLLPPAEFRGKDTSYGHEHVARLRAIRRLQDAYLPLDAIAAELARRSPEEIERLADGRDAPAAAARRAALGPEPDREPAGAPAPAGDTEEAAPEKLPWRAWHRVEIAPGIELSVADDAPVHSRELFARVVKLLESIPNVRRGE